MATVTVKHLESSPGMRGGKLRISHTRITVDDVVILHLRLGRSLEEIAGKYDLPLASVYTAMAYYYDHRAEIDQRIEQDQVYVQAVRENNPSALREKLNALKLD